MARGFKVADAYIELTVDRDQLTRGVKDIPRAVGPDLDRSGKDMGKRLGKSLGDESSRQGEDAGGKLAVGMRMSIIRNSPLIVAAVGAALAVGAPAMIAGATTLFAGMGIVAAAQSDKVRSAWLGTWHEIRQGAIADAAPIQAVLTRMAAAVSQSFERMRPAMRDIFEAVGPQIEQVTRSLLRMAENAMPGFTRAIQGAGPVMQGLGHFLEQIGSGLTAFFDKLTAHSPAAGRAFAALGDIMAQLLPILGELLGQGAELAAIVLPPLAQILGVVANALSALGPVLPMVVAGFGAMKIAQTATGWIGGLADKLRSIPERFAAMSVGAGAVTLGLGIAAAGFAAAEQRTQELARALLEGGAAADQAREAIAGVGQQFDTGSGFMDSFLVGLTGSNLGLSLTRHSALEAGDAYDDLLASMDPVARTSALLEQAENDLSFALKEHGAGSREATAAQFALETAQRNSEEASSSLEMAISGVTEAMLAQADAALALADADLAHRQAVDQADESYAALNEAIRDHGAASEEASDAAMAWESDLSRIVATAGKLATETLPANMDANSRLALSQIAQRDALRELASEYGDKLPPALQAALASLEATTAGYDLASLEAARLSAETEMAGASLDTLNGKEANPKIKGDASIFAGVHADTLGKVKEIDGQTPTPKAKMDASQFAGVHASVMGQVGNLAAQNPTPSAWLNNGPFAGIYNAVMGNIGWLGLQRPTPTVGLADGASGGIDKVALKLAALKDKTVYVTTVERTVKSKWTGGPVVKAATGRKILGPGGPTDDLVQALGPSGEDYRLSAGEWIVNAMASRQQGDAAMALLNAGRATIVPDAGAQAQGFAGGGTGAATATKPISGGNTYNLALHMHGVDWNRPQDRRRILTEFRAGIISLERETQ